MRCPRDVHRLAATLLLAVALSACDKKEAEAPVPVRPVLYTVVEPVSTETFGPFAGTVEPRYQAKLGFQTAGRIVARDVDVGDLVKPGQRLAALDAKLPAFALNQAKADVADAEAQAVNTSSTATRQKTLFGEGSVTKAQLESAVAGADTAAARLAQAKANLQKVQDQFGYTELKADFAGVVTAWSAEVAQVVSAGQSVVTVARPDVKEAVVDIPDGLIDRVHPDASFTVRLQAAPAITAEGRVREIAPQSDAATRSRRVRMTLASPPLSFRLGTTLTVELQRSIAPRIDLPATAIRDHDGRSAVWVVQSAPTGPQPSPEPQPGEARGSAETVTSREVTLLARSAETVTVGNGLEAGDKVVTAGVHSLSDGQAVRLGQPL